MNSLKSFYLAQKPLHCLLRGYRQGEFVGSLVEVFALTSCPEGLAEAIGEDDVLELKLGLYNVGGQKNIDVE
jgi:hypothetical protein